MEKIAWKDAEPIGRSLSAVLYSLRTEDTSGLLLDSVTMNELMHQDGLEAVPLLDALIVQVSHMSVKMERLQSVMNAASVDGLQVADMTIGDPVRQKGTMLVPVLFALSDGQAVTIWFHNPDSSPSKITPMDQLVSWRWMLNKKDITIVVAPERGKDLNIREVARRIMALAAKNAPAFAKANAKAAERMAEDAGLDAEISQLTAELSDISHKIEVARQAQEDRANGPMQITAPENYAKILAGDHSLAITYQDQLDEFFGRRLEAVRDALVNLGWTGERVNAMKKGGYKLETSLYTASASRFIVGVTWNLRNEIDKVASTYTDDLTLDAAAIAARLDAAYTAEQPAADADPTTPDKWGRIDITHPANYARIVAGDMGLAEDYQDELDSFFSGRNIQIRNALRSLGWDGQRYGDLTKGLGLLVIDVKSVGAGRNTVGLTYRVRVDMENIKILQDDLTLTPEQLAGQLDEALANYVPPAPAEETPAPEQDPEPETQRIKDPEEQARELQATLQERASDVTRLLKEDGFKFGMSSGMVRGDVTIFPSSSDLSILKTLAIDAAPYSYWTVAYQDKRIRVEDKLSGTAEELAAEILAVADGFQSAEQLARKQQSDELSKSNPLALRDGDENLLTTPAALRANEIIGKLRGKGFEVSPRSDGTHAHTLIGPYSRGTFTVGVNPFQPEWLEFDDEAEGDYERPTNEQTDQEIVDTIAALDFNEAYGEMDEDTGEVKFHGDGPLAGKPMKFARSAMMVEDGATSASLNVHYGDFRASDSQSLLDSVTGTNTVFGITAQIHTAGIVYARASITEDGAITLLNGASGTEELGTPTTPREVRDMLAQAVNEAKAAKAQAAKEAKKAGRVLVGDVRKAYDSIHYVIRDLQGHTTGEFERANTKYLQQKVDEAKALIERGLPKRGTMPDLPYAITRGEEMIERQAKAHADMLAREAAATAPALPMGTTGAVGGTNRAANEGAASSNPFTEDDEALLSRLMDGTADIGDKSLLERLRVIAIKAEGLPEQERVDKAIEAYGTAVVAHSASMIANLQTKH